MKSDNTQHLSEDQLIRAVVDAADLPDAARNHLSGCRECLNSKTSFELDLQHLGQKAEQFAPKPQRRLILPAAPDKNRIRNLFEWPKLAAAAATVAAVFILVWGTHMVRNTAGPGPGNLTAAMLEAEQLMTEVNTLVDNALPPFYVEISSPENSSSDEDFYRFLIPNTEDDAFTSDRGKKGNELC
jgi:hypothetical protein